MEQKVKTDRLQQNDKQKYYQNNLGIFVPFDRVCQIQETLCIF